MPIMGVDLGPEPIWPDLADRLGTDRLIHLADDAIIRVGALDAGMQSGRPSVAFRFDLPDGRVVVAETSLELFISTARALGSNFRKEWGV